MYWGRSVAIIHFYSSLMYSRVTYEAPTGKIFGPTKYTREKILDPRNTYEKKFWTHGIPTRKNLGPTKYQRENISNPRMHDGTVAGVSRDPQNLAHSTFSW